MSPQIDPKNTSKRSGEGSGLLPDLSGLLPGRFYLKELGVLSVLLLVGLVLYDFSNFVTNSSRYQAEVKVRGLEKLDRQQVLNRLSTIGSGEELVLPSVSVESVRRDIERSLPRLTDVRVRKEYPDELVVSVTERQPAALVARSTDQGERIYLPADRDGNIFRPTDREVEQLPEKLPTVRGFEEVEPGSREFRRKWRQVDRVLVALDETFSEERLNWINVRPGGYVEMQINHPKTLKVRLGVDSYSEKLTKLREMIQTEQFMRIERYVNLSDLDNVRVL